MQETGFHVPSEKIDRFATCYHKDHQSGRLVVSEEQKSGPHGAMFFNGNRGWGFGMAVDLRRDEIEMSPGRFGWDGGYGTSAYADPVEGLIGILMTQRMMDSPAMPLHFRDFWTGAYAAIDD